MVSKNTSVDVGGVWVWLCERLLFGWTPQARNYSHFLGRSSTKGFLTILKLVTMSSTKTKIPTIAP